MRRCGGSAAVRRKVRRFGPPHAQVPDLFSDAAVRSQFVAAVCGGSVASSKALISLVRWFCGGCAVVPPIPLVALGRPPEAVPAPVLRCFIGMKQEAAA